MKFSNIDFIPSLEYKGFAFKKVEKEKEVDGKKGRYSRFVTVNGWELYNEDGEMVYQSFDDTVTSLKILINNGFFVKKT